MSDFLSRLNQSVLVFDGAMGTQLQAKGLPPGGCPEEWNLTHPAVIQEIYENYYRAGANLVTSNTFGGSRIKLAEYGLENQVREINKAAVQLAKEAARKLGVSGLVAGDIGPTGLFLEPLGSLSFEEAYGIFKEQAQALEEGGADVIILETMGDLGEIRAALLACKENTSLPVIASMTFGEGGRTFTGTDPETAAIVLESLGADVIGANCSGGPGELLPILERMARVTNKPLILEPNAGLPKLVDGQAVYDESAAALAQAALTAIEKGAAIVGSCCGSTPEHTAAIAQAVRGEQPKLRQTPFPLRITSRSQNTWIGEGQLPVIIGERINPTGRKILSQEIRENKTDLIRQDALAQTKHGAGVLDINMGVPNIDQVTAMERAVNAVQTLVQTPLMLDSTDPAVLERALQIYHGKALVNSVNGEEKSLAEILPLVKRYGAAVVALTLDDEGIPPTAEGRLAVAKKIVERAEAIGIPRRDILVDCLTLTVSAQPEGVAETLQAIGLIRKELGIATVLGVSNISFGLPQRLLINTSFLSMAVAAGLDAAIINPLEERMREAIHAAAVLTNRDGHAAAYIGHYKKDTAPASPAQGTPVQAGPATTSLKDRCYQAVLTGDRENITALAEEGLQKGIDPMDLLNGGLIPAIEEVGRRFGTGEYFLPQLMLSAETMQRAFTRLQPELAKTAAASTGKVVLATVKGDIHDIGKNIVSVLLQNHGFTVIDLGRNVETSEIIRVAKEEQADLIGLSALMTTTMVRMPDVINAAKEAGLSARVMVGGAVLTPDYATTIGAHGYAKDAVEAVELAKKLLEK